MSFDPKDVKFTEVEGLPEETKEGIDAKKEKKKPKRTKKLTYSKSKYGKIPGTKQLNNFVTGTINKTVLSSHKKKLKASDSEIGEALMYMVEYYTALDMYHPALVIFAACAGLAMATIDCMDKETTTKKIDKTVEVGVEKG